MIVKRGNIFLVTMEINGREVTATLRIKPLSGDLNINDLIP